jgi:hypothetical protein
MPRFVLLFHDCPLGFGRASHWDLMLESGGVLRTWALTELPRISESGWSIDAERLTDHRLAYLEYEGPVSEGRGNVRQVDAGTYETLVEADDHCEVALSGNELRGRITLRQVQDERWTLTVKPCG